MSSSPFDALSTELVENILLQLPMAALLPAQSICKRFHDIIKRSLPLQKALFFAGNPEIDPPCRPGEKPFVGNPLLQTHFSYGEGSEPVDHGYGLVVFEDLLFKYPPDRQPVLLPTASWRDMFITQPPCKLCEMTLSRREAGVELRWGVVCVWCVDGITMGFLVETAEKKFGEIRLFSKDGRTYWIYDDTR